jgi:hypothetical protein
MLSADTGLRNQQPSPLAPKKPAKFGYMPPMIGDSTLADAQNNTRAASAGVGRMALTQMDRGGISRGRGNQYASQIAEAGADAEARAGAANQQMGVDVANAAARQTYDYTMQGEQVGNSGLLENLRNQNAMANWQRRGFGQDMYETHRRGQFGLDQQQLDYTPFLQSLLR